MSDCGPSSDRAFVAVLAGGFGSRLGGSKPAVELDGRALIDYPIAAAKAASLEVVVVAKRSVELPQIACEVIYEPEIPSHPLCGLIAALKHGEGRPSVVVACDMPFVSASLLAWLAGRDGSVVVEACGKLQPLLARYAAESRGALEAALAGRIALTAAVSGLAPQIVGERELRRFGDPAALCFNVNDVDDLAAARRLGVRCSTQ